MLRNKIENWVLTWVFVKDAIRNRENQVFEMMRPSVVENENYLKFQLDKERADIMVAAQKDLRMCMIDETEERAEELANAKLAALLSPIDPTKILALDKRLGIVYIGGEKALDAQLMNLKQEAEALEQFGIWAIMHESVKALAEKAMFVDGENIDTMRKGRSMLYTLSTQQRIIDTLKSYQPPKSSPK